MCERKSKLWEYQLVFLQFWKPLVFTWKIAELQTKLHFCYSELSKHTCIQPSRFNKPRLRVRLQVMTKPGFNKKNWGYHLRPLPLYKFALLAMNRRSYEIVQAQEEGSVSLLTVPKIIDFSRYNMKGGNVILRGIVHVVSGFPPRRVKTTIHLLQEYWQNMQYLIRSCRQESNLNFRPAIKTMLI